MDNKNVEIKVGDIVYVREWRHTDIGFPKHYLIEYKGEVILEDGHFLLYTTTGWKRRIDYYNTDNTDIEVFEVVGNINDIQTNEEQED